MGTCRHFKSIVGAPHLQMIQPAVNHRSLQGEVCFERYTQSIAGQQELPWPARCMKHILDWVFMCMCQMRGSYVTSEHPEFAVLAF